MESNQRAKTPHQLWPDIVMAVNEGEGWNLTIGGVKARYYRNDEVVTQYHTRALERRIRKDQKRQKVIRKNRDVLADMGKVIENSNMYGDDLHQGGK